MARQPRLVQGILAFLDSLLGCTPIVVEAELSASLDSSDDGGLDELREFLLICFSDSEMRC